MLSGFVLTLMLTATISEPADAGGLGSCLSGGCDVVWQANRRIDEGISSKMTSASEPVKKAFSEAMYELFQKHINPLLDRAQVMTNEIMKHIDEIVSKSFASAQSVAPTTIEDVRQKLILETSHEVEALSNSIANKIQCLTINANREAQNLIDKNFRLFTTIRDGISSLFYRCSIDNRNNDWEVFVGVKCQNERKIVQSKSIGELIKS